MVEFTSPTTMTKSGFSAIHGLEGDHDLCRLLGVTAGTNLQVDIGFRHAQIIEKRLGHLFIIMPADNPITDVERGPDDII
jgi:hypothetical protein